MSFDINDVSHSASLLTVLSLINSNEVSQLLFLSSTAYYPNYYLRLTCMYQCAVINNLPWDVWGGGLSGWRERNRDVWLCFPQGGPPSQSRFTIPLSIRTRQTYSTIQSKQRIGKKSITTKKADWITKHYYITIVLKYVVMFDAHQYSKWESIQLSKWQPLTWNYLIGNTTSMGCLTNQNLGKWPLH